MPALNLDANTSDVMAEFQKTRVPPPADADAEIEAKYEELYFQALVSLRPDRLSIDQIAEIVRWVEKTKTPQPDYGPHVNIFGTGGDGTINVSSMAAIIASHFTRVVKVGTPGVTSLWGSFDFMEALKKFISEKELAGKPVHPFMKWGAGSKYLALAELNFDYNKVLRRARKRLKERKDPIPDIYKVVFPFANYTNPQIQINGVSTKVYLEIYDQLARRFNRPVCIVDSEFDIDELMPGKNEIRCWLNGRMHQFSLCFCDSDQDDVWRLVDERDSASQTVELYLSILAGDADLKIRKTIFQNAALIVATAQSITRPKPSLPSLIETAYAEIIERVNHPI